VQPHRRRRIQPLGSWRLAPNFHATMTSANGTGVGVEFIASTVVTLGMAIAPVDPRIIPWIDNNMGSGAARFDSTGARAGKHHGSVFPDFIPTYDLIALARTDNYLDGVKESVQHIGDALHQPLIHPWASRRFSAPRRPAPREKTPMPNVEAVTPTANGVILLRDVSADSPHAQRQAVEAARIPGSRVGRLYGAAGAVLLIRCAYQYSRPLVRIETAAPTEQHEESAWQWETPTSLNLPPDASASMPQTTTSPNRCQTSNWKQAQAPTPSHSPIKVSRPGRTSIFIKPPGPFSAGHYPPCSSARIHARWASSGGVSGRHGVARRPRYAWREPISPGYRIAHRCCQSLE
jgi:hypothetical protein